MPSIINEIFFRQHYPEIKKIFIDKGFDKVRIAIGRYGKICLYFEAIEGGYGKRAEVQDEILKLCDKNDVAANLDYAFLSAAPRATVSFDDWILLEAAKNGDLEVAKQAVANRADINAKGKLEFFENFTPMILASANNHVRIMVLLLEEQARIVDLTKADLLNTQDSRGTTPLHAAAFCGHKEALQWLLENGADCDIKNREGKTAEQAAIRPEIAQLIRDFDEVAKIMTSISDMPKQKEQEAVRQPVVAIVPRAGLFQVQAHREESTTEVQAQVKKWSV